MCATIFCRAGHDFDLVDQQGEANQGFTRGPWHEYEYIYISSNLLMNSLPVIVLFLITFIIVGIYTYVYRVVRISCDKL